MVKRFDSARIERFERTPQGGLRIPARPTRVGVFVYRNADGSERREFRPPEEVFAPVSLKSLCGAPVTDLHPQGSVTPENWKALSVGHAAEDVRADGDHVACTLLIQDVTEIQLIESGARQELSCGYECSIESTPGTYNGEPYDVIQRGVIYNHVGIGPEGWGRQGASVAIRLDSTDAVQVSEKPRNRMIKLVRIDGIDYEIGSDTHLQAVARRDAAQTAKIDAQAVEITALKKERDDAQGRADAAEKTNTELSGKLKVASDPKTIHAIVTKRADMINRVRATCKGAGKRLDAAAEEAMVSGSEDDIMLEALKTMDPSFNPEGKSPDFIKGYFSSLFKSTVKKAEGSETLSEETPTTDTDVAPEDEEDDPPMRQDQGPHNARRGTKRDRRDQRDPHDVTAAEARMRQDSADAWRRPLTMSKDK